MLSLFGALLISAGRCPAFEAPPTPLTQIADDYALIDRANDAGGVFPIRDEDSLRTRDQALEQLIARLNSVDRRRLSALEQTEYSILAEALQSQRDLRICHAERWDLNHITGWQIRLPAEAGSCAR